MKPFVKVAVSETDADASEPTITEDGSATVDTPGEAGLTVTCSDSSLFSETALLLLSPE